jgi:signal transduction histidine kinase
MTPAHLGDLLWRRMALTVTSLLVALLLVVLSAYSLLRASEQEAWRGRQAEAAEAAAQTVEGVVSQVEEAIRFAGILDSDYLTAFPDALDEILRQSEFIEEVVRVDEAGRARASASRADPLLASQFTLPESSWFRTAAQGQRFLGGIQLSPRSPAWMVLALPALDGGAVAARIRAELLWAAVDGIRFGEGGRAYLIDSGGQVLAHSDPALVMERSSLAGRPELRALQGAPEARWSGAYTNFEGREVVGASAPVAGGEWFVLAELPQSEAFAWSRLTWRWLTAALSLLGLLIIATATWLLAQLIWPERLAPSLPALPMSGAQPRLDHTRPLSRADLEALRESFDDMYGRVQDLDRLKSEFLATISHELRTPLNSVIGYAELILSGVNGPLDEEMKKDLQAIYENGHLLLGLVNDLLDLAKIEAGRLELELVRLNLSGLVEEAAEGNARQIEQRGLSLSVEIASEVPLIWGDPVRLRQVLDNLISNAVKFSDEGGLTMRLQQEGDWLSLAVSDTGIGIAESELDTIFERFRQLDGSFTRRAEGTGLGLAISRHLVRMHGGHITVASRLGEGTTFTIHLPIDETPTHLQGLSVGTLL